MSRVSDIQIKSTEQPRTWIECLAENERLRIQVAAMPTEIARQTKALRDERDHFLDEITQLHHEYLTKDCPTCDGAGQVEVAVTCNWPSAHDPWTPAERMELDICEDCQGTGKEW